MEELVTVLLSMLEPQVLAVKSNLLWVNIMAIAIIALVAVGCAVALKKS